MLIKIIKHVGNNDKRKKKRKLKKNIKLLTLLFNMNLVGIS
jgi:hypothetical protein